MSNNIHRSHTSTTPSAELRKVSEDLTFMGNVPFPSLIPLQLLYVPLLTTDCSSVMHLSTLVIDIAVFVTKAFRGDVL